MPAIEAREAALASSNPSRADYDVVHSPSTAYSSLDGINAILITSSKIRCPFDGDERIPMLAPSTYARA